jgi:hypothetical protein
MSNRVYLIGSNSSNSPGITSEGLNYNPDTEILAGASNCVPVLWSSLFKEQDIVFHYVEECKIPTLVVKHSRAIETLGSRLKSVNTAFPQHVNAIKNWQQLLEGSSFNYIKVETLEIWMLNEAGFEKHLRSAIRWYESNSVEDMRSLISLAEAKYDESQRELVIPEGEVADYYLHGYRWVREVPWPDL